MRSVLILGIAVSLALSACASGPNLPSLVEQRQVLEQRALGRYEGGDLVDAAHNFRQAVQLAELADDRNALITNLLNLGSVESERGHHDAALRAFERASSLAALEHRDDLELRAVAGLAEVNYRLNNNEDAALLYRRLIEHPATRGDRELQIMAWNGLALCALDEGDLDAAARHLAHAESLGETAATLLNRATLELRRGDLATAEKAVRRALALDRASGYVAGIAGDLEVLGEVTRLGGDEGEAQLYFSQSLSLYQQLQSQAAVERLRRRQQALSR